MPYNTFYNPYQYQAQSPYLPQMQSTQSQQTLSANNGLIWVQGETGAKSYMVAPGNTVLLMDSEGSRFYLKSSDASGMPLPLRIFEYAEIAPNSRSDGLLKNSTDNTSFVTKAEFDAFKAEINGVLQKGVKTNGKPAVQRVDPEQQ